MQGPRHRHHKMASHGSEWFRRNSPMTRSPPGLLLLYKSWSLCLSMFYTLLWGQAEAEQSLCTVGREAWERLSNHWTLASWRVSYSHQNVYAKHKMALWKSIFDTSKKKRSLSSAVLFRENYSFAQRSAINSRTAAYQLDGRPARKFKWEIFMSYIELSDWNMSV